MRDVTTIGYVRVQNCHDRSEQCYKLRRKVDVDRYTGEQLQQQQSIRMLHILLCLHACTRRVCVCVACFFLEMLCKRGIHVILYVI